MLLKHNYKTGKILYTVRPKKCITHICMNTCMESTPTHNLWFWPKRPPLVFSVAETSVAEMSGPKRPRPKCPRPKCPTFYVNTCEKRGFDSLIKETHPGLKKTKQIKIQR